MGRSSLLYCNVLLAFCDFRFAKVWHQNGFDHGPSAGAGSLLPHGILARALALDHLAAHRDGFPAAHVRYGRQPLHDHRRLAVHTVGAGAAPEGGEHGGGGLRGGDFRSFASDLSLLAGHRGHDVLPVHFREAHCARLLTQREQRLARRRSVRHDVRFRPGAHYILVWVLRIAVHSILRPTVTGTERTPWVFAEFGIALSIGYLVRVAGLDDVGVGL